MRQVTLKVTDSKFQFFIELVKSLDFVQLQGEGDVKESPYDPEFVAKIEQSEKEFEEGNYTTIEKKDLKNFLGL
ncbi:MAG: hypothetical protein HC842_03430 [Cytophagales bacterium]|nr:hypothetical protein [Cytophagales bacterium]